MTASDAPLGTFEEQVMLAVVRTGDMFAWSDDCFVEPTDLIEGGQILEWLLDAVNEDEEVKAWWHVSAVNATRRLGMSDHSWVHIQVVLNIALRVFPGAGAHRCQAASSSFAIQVYRARAA